MSRSLIRIESIKGSSPREVGTEMVVWIDENAPKLPLPGWPHPVGVAMEGSIGGGALELEAIAAALRPGDAEPPSGQRTIALGPELGQCCGGSITVSYRPLSDTENVQEIKKIPVWIWGAGHVGRALVDVLAPMPTLALTWIDTHADRFPAAAPQDVTILPAATPELVVKHAPPTAHHLILTYSHEIDLALCHRLLNHRVASIGLIGSTTKMARFRSRLGRLGHGEKDIDRIRCPIGDPSLGKAPHAIAIGVAAGLIRQTAGAGASERQNL